MKNSYLFNRIRREAARRERRGSGRRRRGGLRFEGLEPRQLLAGTYTGVVFQDYDADGARDVGAAIPNASGVGTIGTAVDRGLAGVTVTAYDPAGNAAGTATTAADGSYALDAGGAGPYRVEFTNLPAGFSSGPRGADNGTSVRFVADGGAMGVDFGAVRPGDFSVDNPFLATQVYHFGSHTGTFANSPTIIGIPYSAGSQHSDPSASNDPATYANPAFSALATYGQVGTTWGLAYNPRAGMVYAAAFFKKHTDFGPGGAGAIYQIPVTYDPATGVFTAAGAPTVLTTLASAAANAHDPADFDTDSWDAGWAAVGTTSLGGLDVSADGSTLYVMNLADKSLYAIPLADPGAAVAHPVPIPADATGPGGADIRPFAVTVHDGLVYIGMVNSAESTQDAADLHAYVYSFDPSSQAYAQVLEVADMTYNRGTVLAGSDPPGGAMWDPWSPTYRNESGVVNHGIYTQPLLTGLSLDAAGNLALGIRDRGGDQFGWGARDNPALPAQTYSGIAGGDTLRATPDGVGTFTIEQGIYASPPNSENSFYSDQNWRLTHSAVTVGGLAQVPGFPDVVTTAFDPANTAPPSSGGIRWFNNATGQADKAYTTYSVSPPNTTFGKSNGMGDLIYMPASAPIEIGNRLWLDADRDGVQDAGEPPLDGVTVELRDGAGNLIATAVTDAQGNYSFSGDPRRASTASAIYGLSLLPDTAYNLVVPPGQPALDGRIRTFADAGGSDARDSDGQPVGANGWTLPITTGGGPGANDHTFDFGFAEPLSLGDRVWQDLDNDGRIDPDEPGVPDLPVRLYRDDDGDGVPDGPPIATATTDADGDYLFPGLPPGNYLVETDIPDGFISSTGTNGSASGPYEGPATPDPDTDLDGDDNGTTVGTVVRSGPVTLDGSEPTDDGDGDPGSNLSVDFGFFQPLSLGDLIWDDRDNDGVVDPGEPGIAGVPVRLLDAAGNVVATTTTGADGRYLFENLVAGDYRVRITPPDGYASSTGTVGAASGPNEAAPDPDGDVNDDDNGTASGGIIESAPISLAPGAEPTDDGDADPDTNLTVDFGLFRPLSLGDLVWEDRDNDGAAGPGEPGVGGVPVELLDAVGNVIATTTTGADGRYLFDNLVAGDYRVRITPPGGYISSTGTVGSATGPHEGAPDPDGDVNHDDNGTASGGIIESAPISLAPGAEPTGDGDDDPDSNLSVDFGLFRPLSLGDLIWEDVNNNGVADPGEPGIAGLPVELLDANGNVIAVTTTDADGHYRFDNLIAGDYRVRVTPSGGYASSTGTNGSDTGPYEGAPDPDGDLNGDDSGMTSGPYVVSGPISLSDGSEPTDDDADPDTNLTVDFGLFRPARVGDRVILDSDGDGVQDPGEAGVPGVAVRLYDAAGNVVATAVTDADGDYLFDSLVPGTYSIGFDPATLPADTAFTRPGPSGAADPADSDAAPRSGRTEPFALTPGQDDPTRDAGLVPLSSLSGAVFVDLDDDGVRDPGEPPIPGTTVTLTGVDDLGDPVERTAVTGPDGRYAFAGLRPGTYMTTEIQPPGFLDGDDLTGSVGGVPGDDVTRQIVLGAGVDAVAYDFAEISADTCLEGTVYYDLNHNGRRDEGVDLGIAGATVTLTGVDDRGQPVQRAATTDAEGRYRFEGLRPGTYALTEAQPPHFHDYIDAAGTLGGAAGRDQISEIVVGPGECGQGYDFGELQPHGPAGRLRDLAIHVGNATAKLRWRRALDPGRFDAHHPSLGPVLGRGEIPWGVGRFPRAPRLSPQVPTLGTRPIWRSDLRSAALATGPGAATRRSAAIPRGPLALRPAVVRRAAPAGARPRRLDIPTAPATPAR